MSPALLAGVFFFNLESPGLTGLVWCLVGRLGTAGTIINNHRSYNNMVPLYMAFRRLLVNNRQQLASYEPCFER